MEILSLSLSLSLLFSLFLALTLTGCGGSSGGGNDDNKDDGNKYKKTEVSISGKFNASGLGIDEGELKPLAVYNGLAAFTAKGFIEPAEVNGVIEGRLKIKGSVFPIVGTYDKVDKHLSIVAASEDRFIFISAGYDINATDPVFESPNIKTIDSAGDVTIVSSPTIEVPSETEKISEDEIVTVEELPETEKIPEKLRGTWYRCQDFAQCDKLVISEYGVALHVRTATSDWTDLNSSYLFSASNDEVNITIDHTEGTGYRKHGIRLFAEGKLEISSGSDAKSSVADADAELSIGAWGEDDVAYFVKANNPNPYDASTIQAYFPHIDLEGATISNHQARIDTYHGVTVGDDYRQKLATNGFAKDDDDDNCWIKSGVPVGDEKYDLTVDIGEDYREVILGATLAEGSPHNAFVLDALRLQFGAVLPATKTNGVSRAYRVNFTKGSANGNKAYLDDLFDKLEASGNFKIVEKDKPSEYEDEGIQYSAISVAKVNGYWTFVQGRYHDDSSNADISFAVLDDVAINRLGL